MVLQDLAVPARRLRFSILGTDISTEVLQRGRAPRSIRELWSRRCRPECSSATSCAPQTAARELVRIAPGCAAPCTSQHLNLMDEPYPFDRDVDVIFCRNVLIYFDHADAAGR